VLLLVLVLEMRESQSGLTHGSNSNSLNRKESPGFLEDLQR
jgi:hypothetical protein